MLDLNKFSLENLIKIQKVLKTVIEGYEFNPANEENFFVSVEKFKKLGLGFNETVFIFQKIERGENEALKYRGFENISKSGYSEEAYSAMSRSYLREHPLAIKNYRRIKQLYNEILKKLEFKQKANLPSITIPKNIIEDLNKTADWHKSQLEEASKQITSYLQYKNNSIDKLTETIENITKPIRSTLESFDRPMQNLSIADNNYINASFKQLVEPYKLLESRLIDISNKANIFKNIDFSKLIIAVPRQKPVLESFTIAIPKNPREEREAQIALDLNTIKRILLKYEAKDINSLPIKKISETKTANEYVISIKGREIWINNYLLSKPHSIGINLELFEYISSQPANEDITEDNMPLGLKELMTNKRFISILGKIGFKGELLKAFFPKRSKGLLRYKGNKITKNDLKKAGIDMPVFVKELELAHTKNTSPK